MIIIENNGKKKMGRPIKSEEPRNVSLHLRISQNELERIKKCSEQLNMNRTDTLMYGISFIEKETNK